MVERILLLLVFPAAPLAQLENHPKSNAWGGFAYFRNRPLHQPLAHGATPLELTIWRA